jgi:hypothetical protein
MRQCQRGDSLLLYQVDEHDHSREHNLWYQDQQPAEKWHLVTREVALQWDKESRVSG